MYKSSLYNTACMYAEAGELNMYFWYNFQLHNNIIFMGYVKGHKLLMHDQRKIEIQHRATRLIPSLLQMTSVNRLTSLNLGIGKVIVQVIF